MQSFLAFPYCPSHFFIIFLKNRCRTHYPVSYAAHPYKRFSSLYTSVYGMFHKEEFFRHETNQKNRFIWDKKSEREL